LLDQRYRDLEQPLRGVQDRLGIGGRLRKRSRASRPGEVVEPETEDDGPAGSIGGAHPGGDALDQGDERGVDVLQRRRGPAKRTLRANRPPAATRLHRALITVVRGRVQLPAGRSAEQRDEL